MTILFFFSRHFPPRLNIRSNNPHGSLYEHKSKERKEKNTIDVPPPPSLFDWNMNKKRNPTKKQYQRQQLYQEMQYKKKVCNPAFSNMTPNTKSTIT
ncbi:hypothetical protein CDAR_70271 [Caerostris darwini]|uniref:Uncharacterized protein n=1 Tax=Caerostris darwini TaxID=1538125 RepID=A0AAV4PYA0_9ARAC|nr:hypothetical protein CDAR_70271 [Caerostris darwini]